MSVMEMRSDDVGAFAPRWYDAGGEPRYEPFRPEACGPGAGFVALLGIECQACGTPYVAASVVGEDDPPNPWPPSAEGVGSFEYGDAPPWCCRAGATMSSVPRRVLEFWRRDPASRGWMRDPAHEVEWTGYGGWGLGPDA